MLDPSAIEPVDVIDWIKAKTDMAAQPGFKKLMIESLIATACDAKGAPFVAQGIVRARFHSIYGDLGKEALPLVEKLLAGCPGAEGMDQKTIDRLEELKAKFTSNSAAPASGEDQ